VFTDVAKRWMPKVVRQTGGFDHLRIQPNFQTDFRLFADAMLSEAATDLGNFHSVLLPRVEHITFARSHYLGDAGKTTKCR
jgi:hypothetical protein